VLLNAFDVQMTSSDQQAEVTQVSSLEDEHELTTEQSSNVKATMSPWSSNALKVSDSNSAIYIGWI
jgi:hypothetical protein